MQKRRLLFILFLGAWFYKGLGQNPCQLGKSAQAALYYNSENKRSDTFNILKYTIRLELGSTQLPQIAGNTAVRFVPKINNRNFIRLDLLRLLVDSVKEGTAALSYVYNDTILRINFQATKNILDTSLITVYYRGTPQLDPSGFGGFYFNNTQGAQYAYNLGVGFAARPNCYGRVWFPCFDNFVEKSQYEFLITTDTSRRAHCNGQLLSDQIINNKRVRHWKLNEEIPTYLAEVNAANYAQVNWTVPTLSGIKPITLVGVAADTAAMKSGFVNLKNCISCFENFFGPYRWNKFGYSLVPFGGGAMEHATNITYPRNAIGSLSNEYLMAHELSHHWWGNLVTCETPEDMWINEGMASYCADLFYECQYGKKSANERIMRNHENLLHYLFKKEGWRSVSGVPANLTYGSHVYEKGADIAHSLRAYMGDAAFFSACKSVLQQKAYGNMNSNEFRDLLQTASGQNLSDFFSNWVFSPGWSDFSVDSLRLNSSGVTTSATFFIRQKKFGPGSLHSNVPLELSFFDAAWNRVVRRVIMNGASQAFTVSIPFTPVYTALNFDGVLNDASSHEYRTIKSSGYQNFPFGKVSLQVQSAGADSSLLRIVHHFVAPAPFKVNTGARISNQHFWQVDGIFSAGFHTKAQFNYNGFKSTGTEFGYLDTLLTPVNGDSVALFYRRNAGSDWRRETALTKTILNQKSGYFTVDTLKAGEYCFASLSNFELGIKTGSTVKQELKVFPNPASQQLTVELMQRPFAQCSIRIQNMEGKVILTKVYSEPTTLIDIRELAKGTYSLSVVQDKGQVLGTRTFVAQ